jgi:hypothetical protein
MHIEFRLPNGAGGHAATFSKHVITKALAEWGAKRKVLYHTRIEGYIYKVFFDDPAEYSLFTLTWESKGLHSLSWKRITIVDDAEPK